MFSVSKQTARMCPLLRLWLLLTWSTQGTNSVYNNEEFLDHWNESNFLVVWNTQSDFCNTKSGVNIHLDVGKYGIVQNRNGAFYGNATNILYTFGEFPYIKDDKDINGGIPQHGDLKGHKTQVAAAIQNVIPYQDFSGLGVLDWETWRPAWDTNWSAFRIYQARSKELVQGKHEAWNSSQQEAKAKEEFEDSARAFMESALSIAKTSRPSAYWGYYGFPACYNYDHMQKVCASGIVKSNDKIMWLFNTSSALFPSIYIGKGRTPEENAVYVYGILSESMRVAEKVQGKPILPYFMPFYRDASELLQQDDLFATIGQVAALGLPGVVVWAPYNTVKTTEGCKNMQQFVKSALGPFLQKIRSTLQSNRPSYLTFSDNLSNEKWLNSIIGFYKN